MMTGRQPLTDPGPQAPLGDSRARVLDLLRTNDNPVSVQEIAASTGLHANTARFHLDGLVEAGLAARATEDSVKPGRPRTVYQATVEPADGQRSYRLLAEMLTGMLAGTVAKPADVAIDAGREWGRYLVQRPAPAQRVDVPDALRRLRQVLTDAGFAPDDDAEGTAPQIKLRHCPFREIAEQHPEVVCSLHLGLMQGALAEVNAPVTADRLEPFVRPSLCVAHLSADRPSQRSTKAAATSRAVKRR